MKTKYIIKNKIVAIIIDASVASKNGFYNYENNYEGYLQES